MPILEAEEYEEIVEHNTIRRIEEMPNVETFTPNNQNEEVIYLSAFVSRDALASIADDLEMDDEPWATAFKFAEEWPIEAIVNVKTGMIIKARLR